MKKFGPITLVILAVGSVLTPCLGQNSSSSANGDVGRTAPKATNSGTAPEHLGASGWTGGSRGQTKDGATTGQSVRPTDDPEAAKNQPSMATGEDLKGPPTQFPANKTPE